MEANFARYMCAIHPEVAVRYEPFTFRLYSSKIKWYKPDFELSDGKSVWFVEVKGYMDKLSWIKVSEFRKQYPYYELFVFDIRAYNYIKKKYSRQIAGWE